ncbi:MAG TPA: hypothetical protein VMI10_18705 [Terriglobales bacterium]|nr:hypothetical protein [Terriglobales bacterium]
MPADSVEMLRAINAHLRGVLIWLRPERKHCTAVTPQDFMAILEQLMRAAALRDSSRPSRELEKEILEYRDNLKELKRMLPDLQGRLLAERARLETTRSHLAAAAIWAKARKSTF